MGIVATLTLEGNPGTANHTAWQRFLPNGPVALLPLDDNKSSLVWTTSPAEAKRLVGVPAEQFVAELNDALVSRVTQLDSTGSLSRSHCSFHQPKRTPQ